MKKVILFYTLLALLVLIASGCGTATTETVTVTQTVMTPAAVNLGTQTVAPASTAAPAPASFTGAGTTATPKFSLKEGLIRVTLQHDGQHNFIVQLLDSTGKHVGSSWANETGVVNQTKAIRVPADGDYLLDITADGNWVIGIQPG